MAALSSVEPSSTNTNSSAPSANALAIVSDRYSCAFLHGTMQDRLALMLEVGLSIWPASHFHVMDRIEQCKVLQIIVSVENRRVVAAPVGRQGHAPVNV